MSQFVWHNSKRFLLHLSYAVKFMLLGYLCLLAIGRHEYMAWPVIALLLLAIMWPSRQYILSWAYPLCKRSFDLAAIFICSPVLLLMGLPALAIVRCFIAKDIFLKQQRIGYQGKVFTIYKLTTMHRDLAGQLSVNWWGRQLRRWHLDELPQVINILKGEMTLIGPRPEMVSKAHLYEQQIVAYAKRYQAVPGVTGLSQVRLGHVINVSGNRHKVGYDLFYIRRQGFAIDWMIILFTIRALVLAFGGGESQVQQH